MCSVPFSTVDCASIGTTSVTTSISPVPSQPEFNNPSASGGPDTTCVSTTTMPSPYPVRSSVSRYPPSIMPVFSTTNSYVMVHVPSSSGLSVGPDTIRLSNS